jgi:hypothetical protein
MMNARDNNSGISEESKDAKDVLEIPDLEKVIRDAEAKYGATNPEVSKLILERSSVYTNGGDHKSAEVAARVAMHRRQKLYGNDHLDTCKATATYASTLLVQSDDGPKVMEGRGLMNDLINAQPPVAMNDPETAAAIRKALAQADLVAKQQKEHEDDLTGVDHTDEATLSDAERELSIKLIYTADTGNYWEATRLLLIDRTIEAPGPWINYFDQETGDNALMRAAQRGDLNMIQVQH